MPKYESSSCSLSENSGRRRNINRITTNSCSQSDSLYFNSDDERSNLTNCPRSVLIPLLVRQSLMNVDASFLRNRNSAKKWRTKKLYKELKNINLSNKESSSNLGHLPDNTTVNCEQKTLKTIITATTETDKSGARLSGCSSASSSKVKRQYEVNINKNQDFSFNVQCWMQSKGSIHSTRYVTANDSGCDPLKKNKDRIEIKQRERLSKICPYLQRFNNQEMEKLSIHTQTTHDSPNSKVIEISSEMNRTIHLVDEDLQLNMAPDIASVRANETFIPLTAQNEVKIFASNGKPFMFTSVRQRLTDFDSKEQSCSVLTEYVIEDHIFGTRQPQSIKFSANIEENGIQNMSLAIGYGETNDTEKKTKIMGNDKSSTQESLNRNSSVSGLNTVSKFSQEPKPLNDKRSDQFEMDQPLSKVDNTFLNALSIGTTSTNDFATFRINVSDVDPTLTCTTLLQNNSTANQSYASTVFDKTVVLAEESTACNDIIVPQAESIIFHQNQMKKPSTRINIISLPHNNLKAEHHLVEMTNCFLDNNETISQVSLTGKLKEDKSKNTTDFDNRRSSNETSASLSQFPVYKDLSISNRVDAIEIMENVGQNFVDENTQSIIKIDLTQPTNITGEEVKNSVTQNGVTSEKNLKGNNSEKRNSVKNHSEDEGKDKKDDNYKKVDALENGLENDKNTDPYKIEEAIELESSQWKGSQDLYSLYKPTEVIANNENIPDSIYPEKKEKQELDPTLQLRPSVETIDKARNVMEDINVINGSEKVSLTNRTVYDESCIDRIKMLDSTGENEMAKLLVSTSNAILEEANVSVKELGAESKNLIIETEKESEIKFSIKGENDIDNCVVTDIGIDKSPLLKVVVLSDNDSQRITISRVLPTESNLTQKYSIASLLKLTLNKEGRVLIEPIEDGNKEENHMDKNNITRSQMKVIEIVPTNYSTEKSKNMTQPKHEASTVSTENSLVNVTPFETYKEGNISVSSVPLITDVESKKDRVSHSFNQEITKDTAFLFFTTNIVIINESDLKVKDKELSNGISAKTIDNIGLTLDKIVQDKNEQLNQIEPVSDKQLLSIDETLSNENEFFTVKECLCIFDCKNMKKSATCKEPIMVENQLSMTDIDDCIFSPGNFESENGNSILITKDNSKKDESYTGPITDANGESLTKNESLPEKMTLSAKEMAKKETIASMPTEHHPSNYPVQIDDNVSSIQNSIAINIEEMEMGVMKEENGELSKKETDQPLKKESLQLTEGIGVIVNISETEKYQIICDIDIDTKDEKTKDASVLLANKSSKETLDMSLKLVSEIVNNSLIFNDDNIEVLKKMVHMEVERFPNINVIILTNKDRDKMNVYKHLIKHADSVTVAPERLLLNIIVTQNESPTIELYPLENVDEKVQIEMLTIASNQTANICASSLLVPTYTTDCATNQERFDVDIIKEETLPLYSKERKSTVRERLSIDEEIIKRTEMLCHSENGSKKMVNEEILQDSTILEEETIFFEENIISEMERDWQTDSNGERLQKEKRDDLSITKDVYKENSMSVGKKDEVSARRVSGLELGIKASENEAIKKDLPDIDKNAKEALNVIVDSDQRTANSPFVVEVESQETPSRHGNRQITMAYDNPVDSHFKNDNENINSRTTKNTCYTKIDILSGKSSDKISVSRIITKKFGVTSLYSQQSTVIVDENGNVTVESINEKNDDKIKEDKTIALAENADKITIASECTVEPQKLESVSTVQSPIQSNVSTNGGQQ